jgi:hypothetical protein
MPEKVDLLDAQDAAQEQHSDLDMQRLVAPKKLHTIEDLVDDITYELHQEYYYDTDLRAKGFDIVKDIDSAITKLEGIKDDIYRNV